MHGKLSLVAHSGTHTFEQLPQPFEVMRYHSLVIESSTIPEELTVLAKSLSDDEIMAIKHKDYRVYGLQFHPESIGTRFGKQMLTNFLKDIREENVNENISTKVI